MIAQRFKKALISKGYPVHQLYLFGSTARDDAQKWSDIDIAVVCDPFLGSKHEENTQFLLEGSDIDVRIQTVCLRPDDFRNKFFGFPREIERTGVQI